MNLDEVVLNKNVKEITKLEFLDGIYIQTYRPIAVVEFFDEQFLVGEGIVRKK